MSVRRRFRGLRDGLTPRFQHEAVLCGCVLHREASLSMTCSIKAFVESIGAHLFALVLRARHVWGALSRREDDVTQELRISQEIGDAFSEIENGSPRAAAIVSAALIEEKLTEVLRMLLHQDTKLHDEIFGIHGAFGDFGTKINLAFLVGLCSGKAVKELRTICKIRNAFAHVVLVDNFDSDKIRGLVNNLTLHETMKFTFTNINADPPKTIIYGQQKQASLTTRARYIRACTFYTEIFSAHIPLKVSMPEPCI